MKILTPISGTNPPNVPPIDPPGTPPTLIEVVIGTEKFNLNDKGEAVDTTGKVIKTKEEIELLRKPTEPPILSEEQKLAAAKLAEKKTTIEASLIEGAEIELDGTKYTLTKEGTIMKDNKVLKTKEELIALFLANDNEPDEVDYVNEIQKVTNLTIIDDHNKPVTYENTLPGITQYVQDVHKEGRKLGAEEYEATLFSRFPILKNVVEHLTIKGSLEGFAEDTDYSKITITDDENQHVELYTKAKIAQGMSSSEITDMIKYLKEDKKLKDAAITSLNYLKTSQETSSVARANQVKAIKDAQETEEREYWNEVEKALTNKNLVIGDKKFVIPEVIKIREADGKIVTKTIKDFKDYIEKPLQFKIDGKLYTMTQHDFDELQEDTKRTPHNDLFDAYRRFTKYDDSQLIAANASSNIVKQIIKLKSKAGSGGSGTAGTGGKIVLPIK